VGYSVYYDGELRVSSSLSEQHAALVTALVNQEQTEETRAIFAAFAAQPERDLPFHGGLLSVSEDGQLLVPEEDESRHDRFMAQASYRLRFRSAGIHLER